MKGIRVYPDEHGWLDDKAMRQPGAYGRATAYDHVYPGSPMTFWTVTAPNGDQCCLDPKVHQIVEHEDGTITVSPSIQVLTGHRWHGWLKAGIWTVALLMLAGCNQVKPSKPIDCYNGDTETQRLCESKCADLTAWDGDRDGDRLTALMDAHDVEHGHCDAQRRACNVCIAAARAAKAIK